MAYEFEVCQGNLAEDPSTFVVNSSNTLLQIGSGISAAFRKACGEDLQEIMGYAREEFEYKAGKLHQGDVVLTDAAEANHFQYILHAVLMNYQAGQDDHPSLSVIEQCLTNIHKIVKETILSHPNLIQSNNIRLALPLLGTGEGGLDKKQVIALYRDFFIHTQIDAKVTCAIYGFTTEDYELIKSVFLI